MSHIKFDYKTALTFVAQHEFDYLQPAVTAFDAALRDGTGQGADFTGWIDLPKDYDKAEFDRILKAAEKIKSNSDVLIVIGIGGSYLGARAAIESLSHSFYNSLPKAKRGTPHIFFAGNNISSTYMSDLLEAIEGLEVSVNVI